MKKRLEAELISIAHRILKLKNKSELHQLHSETLKLYETLSVLKFVEENMGIVQPKMNVGEIEDKLSVAFDKKEEIIAVEIPKFTNEIFDEVNAATEPELKEGFDEKTEQQAPVIDESFTFLVKSEEEITEKTPTFEPLFEITKEEAKSKEPVIDEKSITKKELKQITFDDLLGHNYNDLTFEKVNEIKPESFKTPIIELKEEAIDDFKEDSKTFEEPIIEIFEEKLVSKPFSLNDNHAKSITFGLNDRIGFEKQLFGGSSEDMNRVVSQLSTYNDFQEAQDFIEDMVKPDYNNWEGKEDYVLRFMEIVERKFI